MYAKLFASLYQGTLRGQSHEILVFTNLLANTGRDGTVDKHFRSIAEETGLTVDEVKAAIAVLEAPDPESRSPEECGARIVRMDEHRVWGWRVVNHAKYRAIRSEEDRAEQNRLAQKRWRERNNSKPTSATTKADKPMQRQEAEAEAGSIKQPPPKDTPPPRKRVPLRASPPLECAAFAEFWTAYPRKVAKANAEKAWLSHQCAGRLPVILTAIRKAKVSADWLKDGGQFIPHPATWLNRRGWEDEMLPSSKGKSSKAGEWLPTEPKVIDLPMPTKEEQEAGRRFMAEVTARATRKA